MLRRILSSNWFAFVILTLAGVSLYLLHDSGKRLETYIGGGVLILSILMVLIGEVLARRERKRSGPARGKRPGGGR
jgi:uncharacterized membrane protein